MLDICSQSQEKTVAVKTFSNSNNRSIAFREYVEEVVDIKSKLIPDDEVRLMLRLLNSFEKYVMVHKEDKGEWTVKESNKSPATIFYYSPDSVLCRKRNPECTNRVMHLPSFDVDSVDALIYKTSYEFHLEFKNILNSTLINHTDCDVIHILDLIRDEKDNSIALDDETRIAVFGGCIDVKLNKLSGLNFYDFINCRRNRYSVFNLNGALYIAYLMENGEDCLVNRLPCFGWHTKTNYPVSII